MIMDNKILEAQGRGSSMGLPRPFFLKSTLFTNSGRGKPLKQPRPWSSGIKMCTIRASKWSIVCFSVTLGSESMKVFVFYDIKEVGYNWPAVYAVNCLLYLHTNCNDTTGTHSDSVPIFWFLKSVSLFFQQLFMKY